MKYLSSAWPFLAALLAACTAATATHTPPAASPEPVLYTDPNRPLEVRIQDLLRRMTLEEKIGQMTQVEKNSLRPGDVTRYFIGSGLRGGGRAPRPGPAPLRPGHAQALHRRRRHAVGLVSHRRHGRAVHAGPGQHAGG